MFTSNLYFCLSQRNNELNEFTNYRVLLSSDETDETERLAQCNVWFLWFIWRFPFNSLISLIRCCRV